MLLWPNTGNTYFQNAFYPKFSSKNGILSDNSEETCFTATLTSSRPLVVVKLISFHAHGSAPLLEPNQCECIENHV